MYQLMSKIWGPKIWYLLHHVSYNYNDSPSYNEKNIYYKFFHYIPNIIPCNICREFYIKFIKKYPIISYLENKNTLIDWEIILHNYVNFKLKKPILDRPVIDKLYIHLDMNIIIELLIILENKYRHNYYIIFFTLLIGVFPNKTIRDNLLTTSPNVFKNFIKLL